MKILSGIFLFLFFSLNNACANLKYLVEDFEGMANGMPVSSKDGMFIYGSSWAFSVKDKTTGKGYSGNRCMVVKFNKGKSYAGWGKGIRSLIELDKQDHFNFYYLLEGGESQKITLNIEEDDNGDGSYNEHHDDSWIKELELLPGEGWRLASFSLSDMTDSNKGGDGSFNANYKQGMILTLNFRFKDIPGNAERACFFDFLSFSDKPIKPVSDAFFNPAPPFAGMYCLLGTWSEMTYDGDYNSIPINFASHLNTRNDAKLSVVHFFKPLAVDGEKKPSLMPDVKSINRLLENGYTPMLTLEIQYIGERKQPDLKDIISGKFDSFLLEYAQTLKNVQGLLLLRLFHEFNGDWYPWCIVNNNNDPELFKQAFRHVRKIFANNGNNNVKFVWCPNSKSLPQQPWNFIVDAYPGDEYVDYLGTDVYNGAERGASVWTSFRKEATENYYLFQKHFPSKPILVCETSSRERVKDEIGEVQGKAEWIKDLSETVQFDMTGIILISWFDQYKKYKVNSTKESRNSYIENLWMNPYFKLSTNKTFPQPFKP